MMLRLNALGGLTLLIKERPAGRRLSQRRRLALLALVGLEEGISRDRVAALLWPEADEERGRHALAQLLYILRRDLRAEDLFIGHDMLRLNETRITLDAREFLAARQRGDNERAVELYRGHLLEGVSLAKSAESEHWLDAKRHRFALEFDAAADAVVAGARAAGDVRHAATVARHRVQLSPFDSSAAAQLVDVLVDAGDLAAAMVFAEQHDTLVREELGHAPDRVFAESVRRLRTRQDETLATSSALGVSRAPRPRPEIASDLPREAPPHVDLASPTARLRLPGGPRLVAAVVALALVGAGTIAASARAFRRPAAVPDRVAVFPFDVRASGDLRFLSTGLIDLLSASLEGTGVLRPADPHDVNRSADQRRQDGQPIDVSPDESARIAARLGASLFVRGSLVETTIGTNGRVRLTAALYRTDAPTVPIVQANADGTRDDVLTLVDRVALALTAGRLGGMAQRFEGIADRSTEPLSAIRSYIDGEASFRAGRYRDAIEAFEQATQEDSTFSLAYYRLAIAYDWAGYPLAMRRAAARAGVRNGRPLPRHERDLLSAIELTTEGFYVRAYDLCRAIVTEYPHDVAAWYQLAELEFHYNPWLGRSFVDARRSFEEVAALAPGDAGAPLHLARIASFEGRGADFDSLMRVYHGLTSERDPETALFEAASRGNAAAQDSVLRTMAGAGADTIIGSSWRLAQYAWAPALAERTVKLLLARDRSVEDHIAAYQLLAYLGVIRQRWSSTETALDSMHLLDPVRADVLGGFLGVTPSVRVSDRELRNLRADLERSIGSSLRERDVPGFSQLGDLDEIRPYLVGELSARLRDGAGVNRNLARLGLLRRTDVDGLKTYTVLLRADSLELAGQPQQAARLLRAAADSSLAKGVWLPAEMRAHLARAATTLRDPREAARWYESFVGSFWMDLTYVPAAESALLSMARARHDSLAIREHDRRLRLLTQ